MNPYRDVFYQSQAKWHGYESLEFAEQKHKERSPYYRWYARGWLPLDRSTPILDIGCGSGQFLYHLRNEGFTNLAGVDLDGDQVKVAQGLGLAAHHQTAGDYFAQHPESAFGLIAMLDIIEHFTREELFPLLETVAARLRPGGRLMASVPNADSPQGLRSIYADITHEIAFTPTSLSELFYCHGLKVVELRDPWPAPVSPARKAYRAVSLAMRRLEALKLRLMGFEPPRYWSSVIWALAEKPL